MSKRPSSPDPDRPEQPDGREAPRAQEGGIHDSLTGVYSIEYFEHQMRSEVAFALRHGTPISLVLMALDYVDELTRAFGAEAHDRALLLVAAEVKALIRAEDVLARYGANELALLCRGTRLEAAGFLATRIRQTVESSALDHRGGELPISVSLGVATLASGIREYAAVVQSAERALDRARAAGNSVVLGGDAP